MENKKFVQEMDCQKGGKQIHNPIRHPKNLIFYHSKFDFQIYQVSSPCIGDRFVKGMKTSSKTNLGYQKTHILTPNTSYSQIMSFHPPVTSLYRGGLQEEQKNSSESNSAPQKTCILTSNTTYSEIMSFHSP